MTNHMPSRS